MTEGQEEGGRSDTGQQGRADMGRKGVRTESGGSSGRQEKSATPRGGYSRPTWIGCKIMYNRHNLRNKGAALL